MLYEDDVVAAVAAHLRANGWQIESTALATQHGDDIVAIRNGERLVVEAKGEGSSKTHTRRYGAPFTNQQASTHIAVAILRCLRVISEGSTIPAIALPDVQSHRREIDRVTTALAKVGIQVYWVSADGSVTTDH